MPREGIKLPSMKVFKRCVEAVPKDMWTCLGTWCSGGPDNAGFTVVFGDLKGHFQPKGFYGSMVLGQ